MDFQSFIVVASNSWARGDSIESALALYKKLHSTSGIKEVGLFAVKGDDKPYINGMGQICHAIDAAAYYCGKMPVSFSSIKKAKE